MGRSCRGSIFFGAHHGFFVRGAHDDAVLVGERGVEGIVGGEGVVPHGGPEEVGLEAEEQIEDPGIELRVHAAELFCCPAAERGGLIVEEDAAILHAGFGLEVTAGCDVERVLMADGDIGPPGPGRDTDLFGEIVDGEDGAALVGAGDDECGADAGEWVRDGLGD